MPASTVIQRMQFCVVSVPPSCTTANCWVFGVTERLAGAPPCCCPTAGGDACAPYFALLLCMFEPTLRSVVLLRLGLQPFDLLIRGWTTRVGWFRVRLDTGGNKALRWDFGSR